MQLGIYFEFNKISSQQLTRIKRKFMGTLFLFLNKFPPSYLFYIINATLFSFRNNECPHYLLLGALHFVPKNPAALISNTRPFLCSYNTVKQKCNNKCNSTSKSMRLVTSFNKYHFSLDSVIDFLKNKMGLGGEMSEILAAMSFIYLFFY